MVGPQGFEPWTLGLKVRCSARLSYRPTIRLGSVLPILSGVGWRFKVNRQRTGCLSSKTISQMRFILVISSEARKLYLGTGLRATILDSSLRCAAFRMTMLRICEIVSLPWSSAGRCGTCYNPFHQRTPNLAGDGLMDTAQVIAVVGILIGIIAILVGIAVLIWQINSQSSRLEIKIETQGKELRNEIIEQGRRVSQAELDQARINGVNSVLLQQTHAHEAPGEAD